MTNSEAFILKKQSQDDTTKTEAAKTTMDSKDKQKAKNATKTNNRRTQSVSLRSHEIVDLVRHFRKNRQQFQSKYRAFPSSTVVEDQMPALYGMSSRTSATSRLEAMVHGMKTSMKRMVDASITLANEIEMMKADIKEFEELIDFMELCDEEYFLMLEEAKEQNLLNRYWAEAEGTEEIIHAIYLDEDDTDEAH